MRRARWAHLLDEDPDFRRWYENLARGSEATARERARVLYRFLRKHDMTPSSLVELGKRDRRGVEDLLMDFIAKLHRQDYSPGYMENYLKAVRSWLEFNGVKLVRRIKIGNRNATPTIADERVPNKRELRQILNYAEERGRCSISLMAFAGLRPQSLGNRRGTDGLKIRDLPEMRVENGEVTFTMKPTRVTVRPELTKGSHKYFTFLTAEGCEYLKAYLEKRSAIGEELTPNSAVIAVKPGYEQTGLRSERSSGHITTKTVTKEIRDAMRPRFKWRPYMLRAYFDTQLLVSENHGKVSHAYRQFYMGHKGDIEARYTTNKGRLPESVIEDMRTAFHNSAEYLETTPKPEKDRKEMLLEMWRQQAKMYGIDPMKVKIEKEAGQPLDLDAEIKAIQLEIKKQIDSLRLKNERDCDGNNCRYENRIVREEELKVLLNKGWQFIAPLNNGKYILRRPLSR